MSKGHALAWESTCLARQATTIRQAVGGRRTMVACRSGAVVCAVVGNPDLVSLRDGPVNLTMNFRGERRSNETPAFENRCRCATSEGNEAKLSKNGNLLVE